MARYRLTVPEGLSSRFVAMAKELERNGYSIVESRRNQGTDQPAAPGEEPSGRSRSTIARLRKENESLSEQVAKLEAEATKLRAELSAFDHDKDGRVGGGRRKSKTSQV